MPRIIAFDFGTKRTGIAVTDPLKIIASPLTTIPPQQVINFIKNYIQFEDVELFVVGQPKHLNNEPSQVETSILSFISSLQQNFPQIPITRFDERFTSKIASLSILQSGAKKKQRQNKEIIDQVSATIILQDYLSSQSN